MTPRSVSPLLLLLLAGSALADPNTPGRTAAPAPRFTLLVRSQPPEPVALLAITADNPAQTSQLTYLDGAGKQQTRSLADIIALAPPTWVPTPESTTPFIDDLTSDLPVHRLDLADGQRFVGVFADAPELPSARADDFPVYFRHDKLGTLAFPLDRVLRYWSDAKRPTDVASRPLSAASDTIVLANGDRLEGLVTRLGQTIWIETKPVGGGAAPAPTHEPASQIDARQALLVQLVNPARPLKTLRLDLADGSILAVDRLNVQTAGGRMIFHAIDGATRDPVTADIGQLAGIVPDASRLVPLCSLPIAEQHPASGRVPTAPAQVLSDAGAPLEAGDILLPAPMTLEWAIPAGVTSILGYAQMDDRSFAWGDCVAIVSIAPAPKGSPEREIARGRLNADSPTLTISSDLGTLKPGDRLRVRIDPGERGPIQDRVVLRRMMLLN